MSDIENYTKKRLNANDREFAKLICCDGYSYVNAYKKAYKNAKELNKTAIYDRIYSMRQSPVFVQFMEKLNKEILEQATKRCVWTKELALCELKDLLYRNKREADRYDKAYDDSVDFINDKLSELKLIIESEQENPTLSKKEYIEICKQYEQYKLDLIKVNKTHYMNITVNQTIIDCIHQLNTLMNFEKEKVSLKAEISFIDDVPQTDN